MTSLENANSQVACDDLKKLEMTIRGKVFSLLIPVVSASNLPFAQQTYTKVSFNGKDFRTSVFGESTSPKWEELSNPLYNFFSLILVTLTEFVLKNMSD